MPRAIDLTGRRFGALTALRPAPPEADPIGRRRWVCRCDCGAEAAVLTALLTRGRTRSCPACSGSALRDRSARRTCRACGAEFVGDVRATVCSAECRAARRRGREAGAESLPPVERPCAACGRPSRVRRGLVRACSRECLAELKRARWRDYWRRHPEKQAEAIARRKERRAIDPAAARAADKRKYARIAADPARKAKVRQAARAHYRRHAGTILARRRARLKQLPEAEQAVPAAKSREYQRRWRARRRSDPAAAAAERAAYREWKRRRKLGLLGLDAAALLAEATRRLAGASSRPARPCVVCGAPLPGRHPSAKTCSPECRRRRHNDLVHPRRVRPCIVCGAEFDAPTSATCCSPGCRAERKRSWRRETPDGR